MPANSSLLLLSSSLALLIAVGVSPPPLCLAQQQQGQGPTATPPCSTEREVLLANAGVTDLALSVAHYTPTLAEIYAAFPDTIASAFAAGKSSTVVVSLTLSLHLDEASGDLKTQSLKWAGSPGWKLSYAVDDMPSARVAIVQASLKRKASSHLLLDEPRLLSMRFPQAVSHVCIAEAEMSVDEGSSLNVLVNNDLACGFDVIATGVVTDENDGVGVYGRSNGHDPIVSFQVQLRCGEQASLSSMALGKDLPLVPAGLASTAGMKVISSKQTGIIAGVALNDSSTIQSWMGVAAIIATSIFQDSNDESCVDSLQISRMELADSAGQALKVGILPTSTSSGAADAAPYSSAVGSITLVNNQAIPCNATKQATDDTLVSVRVDFQVDTNTPLLISSLIIDFSDSFSPGDFRINGVFLSPNDACTEDTICSPSLSHDKSGRFVHIDLEHNATHASLFQSEQASPAAPSCGSLNLEPLASLNPPLHIPPTNCIPYHMKNSSISWDIVLSFEFTDYDVQGTVNLALAKASLRGVVEKAINLNTAQASTSFNVTGPPASKSWLSQSGQIAIVSALIFAALFMAVLGLYFVRRQHRYRNLAFRRSTSNGVSERSQLTKCNTRDERDNLGIDLQVLAAQTTVDSMSNKQEDKQDDEDDDELQLLKRTGRRREK